MAAPAYTTDLTLIDDAQDVTPYVATGGGASALNDETDYFINGTQCVSKNGFTATQKGQMYDNTTAPTITAGDAVFIWGRQANRNILDTVANSGGAVIMGTSNSVFAGFDVDGNDVDGSNLLSWVSYAVDPTQSSDYTSGSPGAASTWDHFGMEWAILGSGSLKGAPNAIGVSRHGRELRMTDGDLGNGYATFTGAAAFDSDTTRRWGLLTEGTGTLLFHGALVLGQAASPVDFRDSNVSISVLNDPHLPSAFNEIEIVDTNSNVEWTNIQISHLAATPASRTTLTLDVGTFTGASCRFDGCSTTTFRNSSSSCIDTTWANCDRVNLEDADLSGSSFLTPIVAADEGAVFDNRSTTSATSISELDDCTFEQGTNAHHAIRFGVAVNDDITLTGIEFTGFSSSDDVNGSTLRFDATAGSINVNLVDCTVDGAAATTANIGIDDAAGITVTVVISPVTISLNAKNQQGENVEGARVQIESAELTGDLPYMASISITRSGSTASVSHTGHGMANGDVVVIRHADQTEYTGNKTISNVSTNAYDFTVSGTPTTPATSSLDVLINEQDETDYDELGGNGAFDGGFAHVAGDVISFAQGFRARIDAASNVVMVDAQDFTNYDGVGGNGTFDGGTGHAVSDDITLTNGVLITVDLVSSGVVTEFVLDTTGQTGTVEPGDTITQASTTGSGTDFSLTLGINNLTGGVTSQFTVLSGEQTSSAVSAIEYIQTDTTGFGYNFGVTPESPNNIDADFIGASQLLITGLTDALGDISVTRTLSVDQNMKGWARKSTSSPLYKQTPVSFTADATIGNTINVLLLDDE